MGIPIYHVDAFTDQVFCGNPAAVCILSKAADPKWMQAIAAEMNLSETAFVLKTSEGFKLRWFTPVAEVKLCGHATLATAHTLWQQGLWPHTQALLFDTLSGLLSVRQNEQSIEMDFPACGPVAVESPKGLNEALAIKPVFVGRNNMDYLILLESENQLRQLEPDLQQLGKIDGRGFIVTAPSHSKHFDFVSRFFAPRVGVNEDPVTGSAHCCLAPFWSTRLGKTKLIGYQASKRGGTVEMKVKKDRVILCGQAVTICSGKILI